MNIKFCVALSLFAFTVTGNGAANAQARDDSFSEPSQSQNQNAVRHHASSRRHASRRLKNRKVQTRQVSLRADAPARGEASENHSSFADLIAAKAAAHGVPVALANAVVRVESNYNPQATGSAGEVGLMQIKYQTARGLGYAGTRSGLYDPATNLEWGMRYLAGAHRLAGGSLCGTLAKYQGGHGTRGTRTSFNYCGRVRTAMAARGA